MTVKKPELLLPAGNYEKMLSAFRFGADAVYLAGKSFGLRSSADNFTIDELDDAIKYAHSLGKKVYITLNSTPRCHEFDDLEKYLKALDGISPDAFIVASPGVMDLSKKILPSVDIHLSTQAGAVSAEDCNFWHRMGVTRVVLARELSFEDISAIRSKISPELELETFIHGSMCVSWSGRCLLSKYMTGRDANTGQCTQPCRWNFKVFEIEEEKRAGERYPVYQNDLGTFVLSSKDMCMIEHIPELCRSGVASFKIEGRMKSAYYAAITANAYRMAIDKYLADPDGYLYDERLLAELETVSHREYCAGYYFEEPSYENNTVTNMGYIREKAYLARVISYDKETKRAYLFQRNKMVNGQIAELVTPGKFGIPFTVKNMSDKYGNPIDSAPHPLMEFYIESDIEMHEGDLIRGAE